jgi:hypothetical protein
MSSKKNKRGQQHGSVKNAHPLSKLSTSSSAPPQTPPSSPSEDDNAIPVDQNYASARDENKKQINAEELRNALQRCAQIESENKQQQQQEEVGKTQSEQQQHPINATENNNSDISAHAASAWTEETKTEIQQQILHFRNRVDDLLTAEAVDRAEAEMRDWMLQFSRGDPAVYERIFISCSALTMLFALRRLFIYTSHHLAEGEMRERAIANLSQQKFMFPREFCDTLLQELVFSLERTESEPVRLQRYRDMLYPHHWITFEKFISPEIHNWLQVSAEAKIQDLNVKLANNELTHVDPAYVQELRDHLNIYAAGRLPWDFVSEEELEDPRVVLHFSELLDPSLHSKFDRTLTSAQFEWLRARATKQWMELQAAFVALKKTDPLYQFNEKTKKLMEHLQAISRGHPPFGFSITEDNHGTIQGKPGLESPQNTATVIPTISPSVINSRSTRMDASNSIP